MELLAPAGSPDCLEPAVRCGADAVYLGASRFSARGRAANFDRAALAQAAAYCHARGVKLYLALNTLLRDDELPEALALAEYACSLPVDALIVQDIGLIRLLRACAPDLKLSASTQMSIHTAAGAQLCAEWGMRRVVLARELSADELRTIRERTAIELEAFVHGALCMSVSGQCYFSAMLGGRSGNRGLCAQPCRLPFAAPGGTGHDLSLKDLSLIPRLSELAAAGVCSAKIEGRMKRPEYVAAAVTACRCALDGTPEPDGLPELLQAVFSRSGFTQGYFDGHRSRNMFGIRQKEGAEPSSASVRARLHELYRNERARIPVEIDFAAPADGPCTLVMRDGTHTVTVAGPAAEIARTAPLTTERAAQQLGRLGGTPFKPAAVRCAIADGRTVPMAALNALRRQAAEALLTARAAGTPIPFRRTDTPPERPELPAGGPDLRLHFADAAQIPAHLPADTGLVYVPASTPADVLRALRTRVPLAVELPRGAFGTEDALTAQLARCAELGIHDVGCGTLNAVAIARNGGCTIHGTYGLNLFNSRALDALAELGAADAELSTELTFRQMAQLRKPLPCTVLIYGRLPLMLTRCCPIRNGTDCTHCDKHGALTDRKGLRFPVRCAGGCSEVLNPVPLCWLDRPRELPPVSHLSMRFSVENSVEIAEILDCYTLKKRPNGLITRGLYENGVF